MQAVLKAQINKTDRNDARGIAQMMRVGLYRPVHVKTLHSQKLRMLLTHRKLLQSKAIAIENDLRATLRNFGLNRIDRFRPVLGVLAKGGKQPYAIGMKDGAPFGLAGLWENWKDPAADEWVRTFTIITVPSDDLRVVGFLAGVLT